MQRRGRSRGARRCYHPRVPAAPPSGTPLPAAFRRRMEGLLGDEAAALFDALGRPPVVGLRVNTLRGPVATLAARLPWPLEALPWCEEGFVVAAPPPAPGRAAGVPPPGRHPYQDAGVYYLQDPAAMMVAAALAPRPGELVIDLAAAPGGKSTHLAARLAGRGWLVANDVHPQRARALIGNLERCGVANATVTNEAPARLAERWPGAFDRVLLDAPCSGEGMFRKSEEALAMWSEAAVASCARRQDELLLAAAELVAPGGHLAYSTCTFAPEENERLVAAFLAARPDFALVPLALPGTAPGRPDWVPGGAPALAGAARVWPHRAPGEGHFVALLRRDPDAPAARGADRGAATATPTDAPTGARRHRGAPAGRRATGRGTARAAAVLDADARAAWERFAATTLADGWAARLAPTARQGDWLGRAAGAPAPNADPAAPLDPNGLRWLRHGLQLGRARGGRDGARLEPAHALAMALPGEAVRERLSLPPDDARLPAFLAGADLEAAGEPGYVRVEVDGFPLGWGKRSGGVVRSLLPKGLRRPG
ncbi:MAG: hypothetical protein GX560_05050 [Deinococcales bacterium]|nr:hypothetical protein [Deinococcales bacterium]